MQRVINLVQTPWMRHRIQLSPLLYLCLVPQLLSEVYSVFFLVLGLDLVVLLQLFHFLMAP